MNTDALPLKDIIFLPYEYEISIKEGYKVSQEKIRLQVFFMKKWKSYSEIAEAVKINKHTFYGWLDGNFNLSEEQL